MYNYLKSNPIMGVGILLTLVILSPILSVFTSVFDLDLGVWKHLKDTVLLGYIYNTFLMLILVSFFVLLISVPTAYIVVRYRFFMSKFFSSAFIFPLAIPAYIMAFSYVMFFEYEGLFHNLIRFFGFAGVYNLDVINIFLACLCLSFSFFPYVYVLVRVSFSHSLNSVLEPCRSLNINDSKLFFKALLPLAKPSIFAGLSLVLMETLSDYGTVSYFGVNTFSVGIFKTWQNYGDINSAMSLSSSFLLFIFAVLVFYKLSQNKNIYGFLSLTNRVPITKILRGYKAFFAFLWCFVLIIICFLLPVSVLVFNAINNLDYIDLSLLKALGNTLLLALISSFFAVLLALIIVYSSKISKNKFSDISTFLVSLGYATPGAIVAIGMLVLLKFLDGILIFFGINTDIIISGGIFAVIFAYIVRFISIPVGAIESNYLKNKNMHEASLALEPRKMHGLLKVDIFILKGSLLSSFLLVFMDSLKELPATLLLRPFNFDTLAIKTFYLAGNDQIAAASIPALFLIFVGIIMVFIINYRK